MQKASTQIISILLFLLAAPLTAAPIDEALNAYKQKQYHQAAKVILNSTVNLNALEAKNKLKVAIIFSKNAKLSKDIASKSQTTQQIFLESLLTENDKDKSIFLYLYLTDIYLQLEKYDDAEAQIEQFLSNSSVDVNYKNLAKIYQAWIALRKGKKDEFHTIANDLKDKHLITDMAIGFIQAREKQPIENNESLSNNIKEAFFNNRNVLTTRAGNYALRIFVANHSLEDAREIYNRLTFHAPSYTEKITTNKIINFYESTLADTLHSFYMEYAKNLLHQIKDDKKYGDTATFYLSDLLIFENDEKSANEYSNKVEALRLLPKKQSQLKAVRASTHGFLDGKRSRAYQVWKEAVENDKNDPFISADAVLMCLTVEGNCPTLVQTAQLAAENGKSKRFEELSRNVGRYFLAKNLEDKALRLLEYALDRSDMNSLLANEPILLLNLAEAYRANKKFAKSLQIYFSLGENFPVMRQIQDAVQGEYLFQQRSSGQSNVF